MQPSELRGAMRQRRKELRALLPLFRARARRLSASGRFATAALTAARRKKRARRVRGTLTAMAVLLLALLLIRCDRGRGSAARIAAAPEASVTPTPTAPTPRPTPKLQARLETQRRAGYGLDDRPPPDWIDDFRLQVAARGPRIAECFNGAERGGTFRWTVSIAAASGTATDHLLESIGPGTELGREQKECATRALSTPGYVLKAPRKGILPDRVSLVIEF